MNKKSTINLHDGNKIPIIGYGTWLLEGKDTLASIQGAIDAGYKHIDTAQIYNNEYEIGQVIAKNKRENLFITSKIWPINYLHYTRKSIVESLRRLKLTYLDLMLLHWPINNHDEINVHAFKELINAKNEGYIKSIGVSNFKIDQLKTLYKMTGEWPTINQIIFNPKIQSDKLIKFCKSKGIVVEGYSLLRPLFSPRKYSGKFTQKEIEYINLIASKYNKKPAQIIIRWALQRGIVVFPKSKNLERIQENINVFDFELSSSEMKMINNMKETNNDEQIDNKELDLDFDKGLLFEKHFKL